MSALFSKKEVSDSNVEVDQGWSGDKLASHSLKEHLAPSALVPVCNSISWTYQSTSQGQSGAQMVPGFG